MCSALLTKKKAPENPACLLGLLFDPPYRNLLSGSYIRLETRQIARHVELAPQKNPRKWQ